MLFTSMNNIKRLEIFSALPKIEFNSPDSDKHILHISAGLYLIMFIFFDKLQL